MREKSIVISLTHNTSSSSSFSSTYIILRRVYVYIHQDYFQSNFLTIEESIIITHIKEYKEKKKVKKGEEKKIHPHKKNLLTSQSHLFLLTQLNVGNKEKNIYKKVLSGKEKGI